MADTKISALTDGTTAEASDRIAVARDPTGTPLSRYITPAYIRTYLLGLANTWTAAQTLTQGTITADAPQLNGSVTWNNSGVTFTAWKLNVTDTASASSSLLMDLQIGGASKFRIAKTGAISIDPANPAAVGSLSVGGSLALNYYGGYNAGIQPVNIQAPGGLAIVGTNQKLTLSASNDLFLTRRGAANLRFGAADAAAPVAQTLSVQSVVAGTTDTAGANLTITGSQGTGTGAGGSIIFQTAPAGSSGTAQNALATVLTLSSAAAATFTGSIVSTSATAGMGYATGAGGAVTQATSRTTGVTLDKICGAITLVSAAGSTSWQSFTVTNSTVAATDTVRIVQKSGTDLYQVFITNVAAGSFQVTYATTGGTTTEQPVFNFSVIKAVAA